MFRLEIVEGRDVLLGYQQQMRGRGRLDVPKRQNLIILEDLLRRNRAHL